MKADAKLAPAKVMPGAEFVGLAVEEDEAPVEPLPVHVYKDKYILHHVQLLL